MPPSLRRLAALVPLLALPLAVPLLVGAPARAANPDVLLQLVAGRCVPDQREHDSPAPCARVDLASGTAVLTDNSQEKPTHFLLIPTVRTTGIEDPAILSPDAPNYFAAAWEARALVAGLLRHDVPRDWIGLAINSRNGRTQNQLHIHIDCVQPDVRDALHASEAKLDGSWRSFPLPKYGHDIRAMRVSGEGLSAIHPFLLLADGIPGARADMARQTLAVVGAVFADGTPGFYLVEDSSDLAVGDVGSAEEMLDYTCTGPSGK